MSSQLRNAKLSYQEPSLRSPQAAITNEFSFATNKFTRHKLSLLETLGRTRIANTNNEDTQIKQKLYQLQSLPKDLASKFKKEQKSSTIDVN